MNDIENGFDIDAALAKFRADAHVAGRILGQNERSELLTQLHDPDIKTLARNSLETEQATSLGELAVTGQTDLYASLGQENIRLSNEHRYATTMLIQAEAAAEAEAAEKRAELDHELDLLSKIAPGALAEGRRLATSKANVASTAAIREAQDDVEIAELEEEELGRLFAAMKPKGIESLYGEDVNSEDIGAAWPIPRLVNINTLATKAEKKPKRTPQWETDFLGKVGEAISQLEADDLMHEGEISARNAGLKSSSSKMGTAESIDRLHRAGIFGAIPSGNAAKINLPMTPSHLVISTLLNANPEYLGKGPRQKKAIQLVDQAVESYFQKQRKNSAKK